MATVAPRLFDMSSGGAANASRAEGSGTHTEDGLDPVNIGTIKIGTDPIDYPSDANGSSRSSSEQQSPSGDEKSTSPPLAVSTASITLNLPTQTNSVPSTSDFQPSTSASVLPSPSSKRQSRQIAAYFDDQHIYANVREMEEVNSRPVPPAPSPDAVPTRDLKNGWLEFENELGRTFFYNVDTGKTQWIPPRFLRTPAEVQAMLKARGELMDFVCSTSSSAPVEQKHDDHLQANPHQTENGQQSKVEERRQEEEIFDEPAEEPSDREDHLHEDDGRFDDDNESEQFDEPAEDEEGFYQQAPPLPIKKNSGEFNNSGSPLMTSFMASNSQTDNFASSLMQPSTSDRPIQGEANRRENHRHSSPQANAASRSLSFNNRPKHVPVPQVQPTTSGNGACFGSVPTPIYNHEYAVPPPCPNSDCKPIPTSMMHSYSHTLDRPPFHRGDQQRSVDSKSSIENERRCSSESREPVRTIRSGNMERCEWNETNKGRKREWVHGFVYLTSAHFILYKDERSAEKHGKHYDAPLCVWDLKGATISWNVEKDKKKRKVIQLELCNACRYLLRTSNDNETQEWFEALRDVIARLPPPTHQEIQSAILDSNSCSVMRNPSLVSHTPRPVSAASTVIVNKTRLRGRSDVMAQSAIETSTFEEGRPNRETILEKLRRFFRTRPSMETLKEKGIYKPEPVFGSTLSTICQHEKSLVPKFIRVVIEVIESKGLDTDGLYRVSGNLSAVQKIRCHVDQDNYKALVNEEDVHVLTGAFKLFFRELSEPLFPPSMHKDYISAMQNPIASSRFKKFDELLARLPSENKETLKSVLKHLTSVASHSQQNRMQLHNLSIMFGPTLFQSGERDEKKKGGKETNKKKKAPKEEKSAPVQSNSHLAFSMIMQSQIVQYLLETYQKFDALKGPIQYIP